MGTQLQATAVLLFDRFHPGQLVPLIWVISLAVYGVAR